MNARQWDRHDSSFRDSRVEVELVMITASGIETRSAYGTHGWTVHILGDGFKHPQAPPCR